LDYNKHTLKFFSQIALTLAAGFLVCFLVVISTPPPPRDVYQGGLFVPVTIVARGTAGTRAVAIRGRLDERFVVSWPKGLKVGMLDWVVVRIAANDYEDLLKGIDEAGRDIKEERFKGEPRLVVTLNYDSGLEVIKRHNDEQVVVRGQRHREWGWSILPKATGPHQLILLVQGVRGKIHEDYDPEIKEYTVAFNFWYWLWNGVQQNGVSWGWALIMLVISDAISYWFGRHSRRKAS
jgi:hypothetical protein